MSLSLYQQEMLEHAEHPRNFGTLDHPDLQGRRTNPTCGDEVTMAVKFTDEKVSDVAFAGSGCSVSQAWASMLTEWVKGKTREELNALSEEQHLTLLDVPLTPSRRPCALLSLQALQEALRA
jgi:nitrogen fixation NifU-like protein